MMTGVKLCRTEPLLLLRDGTMFVGLTSRFRRRRRIFVLTRGSEEALDIFWVVHPEMTITKNVHWAR
jgi:hypothetical protein